MQPTAPQHPSKADLAAFALGKLKSDSAIWIKRHLLECSGCRQVVERTPTNSLVQLLNRGSSEAAGSLSSFWPANVPNELPPALRDHPRYRIIRQLGQGGMGVVYQAEHRMMERLVAIKVINRALLDHPDAVERFNREVRAAAKLDHPNIVKAFDAEQAGDLQLLVMEFVEGRSLAEVLENNGPLPVAYACQCVRQAAKGLQHAFEKEMVHRDLKPHNLMLTSKGIVKILDFGLAKLVSEQRTAGALTQQNVMMGTPEYLAPEQAKDTRSADIRADIYSLGCALFCLLAGRPPFTGDSALQIVIAQLEQSPPRLDELRSDVPTELAELVGRMIAKDPDMRPQTPMAVAEALLPFSKPGRTPATLAPAAATAPARSAQVVASPQAGLRKETGSRGRAGPRGGPGAQRARHPAWLVPAVVAVGVLLIGAGLWGGGAFRAKPPAAPSAGEVNEPAGKSFAAETKTEASGEPAKAGSEPVTAPKTTPEPLPIVRATPPILESTTGSVRAGTVKEIQQQWADYLGTPVIETIDLGGGVKMEFMLIPPGEFMMGSPDDDKDADNDEKPRHTVRITKPFYLGRTAVTKGQFARFVDETGEKSEAERDGQGGSGYNAYKNELEGRNPQYTWRNTGWTLTDEHPVVNVTHNDAVRFCEWVKEGNPDWKLRLPTEAEWEYACRGGTNSRFFTGNDPSSLEGYANLPDVSLKAKKIKGPNPGLYFNFDDGYPFTSPVGRFKANPLGLLDMTGNVFQWCANWHDTGAYKNSNQDERAWTDAKQKKRVFRGGSWTSTSKLARCANRSAAEPDFRYIFLGFRVVLDAPDLAAPLAAPESVPIPASPAERKTPPEAGVGGSPDLPEASGVSAPKQEFPAVLRRAEVVTTHGRFVIQLEPERAPKTCAEFLNAAEAKQFDGGVLRWRSIGNKRVYDKTSGSEPMAAGVILAPFRWLDEPPRQEPADKLALCVDNRNGEDKSWLTVEKICPPPGVHQFGRISEGRQTLEHVAGGWWLMKGGKREPRLRLMHEKVVVQQVRPLPSLRPSDQ